MGVCEVTYLLFVMGFLSTANAGYTYEVVSSDDETIIVDGPDGIYKCEAMSYCFGLDEGDSVVFIKSPYLYVNDPIVYGSKSCDIWDCDLLRPHTVSAPTPPAPVVIPSSEVPCRTLSGQDAYTYCQFPSGAIQIDGGPGNVGKIFSEGSLAALAVERMYGHHSSSTSTSITTPAQSVPSLPTYQPSLSGTILCNDGTRSPTCGTCRKGCCSHHGGCR